MIKRVKMYADGHTSEANVGTTRYQPDPLSREIEADPEHVLRLESMGFTRTAPPPPSSNEQPPATFKGTPFANYEVRGVTYTAGSDGFFTIDPAHIAGILASGCIRVAPISESTP